MEVIEFYDYRQAARQEYRATLNSIFEAAWEKSGFDFVCTVLRVGPAQIGHWDPMAETVEAFDDYLRIINAEIESGNQKGIYRIGLLTYCHLIEMSAIHDLLANLIRIHQGKPYTSWPLGDLVGRSKKDPLKSFPASSTTKFKRIKGMADEAGLDHLSAAIDEFFDDRIRNSFFHSDYCLTDTEYRWTEGGPASSVDLNRIAEIMARSFAFYEEIIGALDRWLRSLATAPRYHKWPDFIVFELLSEDGRLYGFRYHFPNGSTSFFERSDKKVVFGNMRLNHENGVVPIVTGPSASDPDWRVNGVLLE